MRRHDTSWLRWVPVASVVLIVSAAAFGGWDLTKPLIEFFPPPIAVEPDSLGSGIATRKNGGPSLEDEVMELVNQARWDNGQLPPLKRNGLLDSSSETHSANMATRNFFAHCDLDTGTSPWSRMTAAGYAWNAAAENIAGGNSTAAATMAQWMASPDHRDNILSTDYRELGIGYVHDPADAANVRKDSDGNCMADGLLLWPLVHYWTQNFGRRNTVYPVVINREADSTMSRDVDLYLYGGGWATEMRVRNENGTWTSWQPFASDVEWQVSAGAGTKEVFVEIRQGTTVGASSDTILSTVSSDPNLIFEDDFESHNTDAWSSTVP